MSTENTTINDLLEILESDNSGIYREMIEKSEVFEDKNQLVETNKTEDKSIKIEPQSDYEMIADYLKVKTIVNKIRNNQLEDLWNRGWMVDKMSTENTIINDLFEILESDNSGIYREMIEKSEVFEDKNQLVDTNKTEDKSIKIEPQSDYEMIADYLKVKTIVNKIRNDQLEDLWNRGWLDG
jgi:adenine C2-methylase RlmN of 23S rRNA A2503 and tRNA A37